VRVEGRAAEASVDVLKDALSYRSQGLEFCEFFRTCIDMAKESVCFATRSRAALGINPSALRPGRVCSLDWDR